MDFNTKVKDLTVEELLKHKNDFIVSEDCIETISDSQREYFSKELFNKIKNHNGVFKDSINGDSISLDHLAFILLGRDANLSIPKYDCIEQIYDYKMDSLVQPNKLMGYVLKSHLDGSLLTINKDDLIKAIKNCDMFVTNAKVISSKSALSIHTIGIESNNYLFRKAKKLVDSFLVATLKDRNIGDIKTTGYGSRIDYIFNININKDPNRLRLATFKIRVYSKSRNRVTMGYIFESPELGFVSNDISFCVYVNDDNVDIRLSSHINNLLSTLFNSSSIPTRNKQEEYELSATLKDLV